MVMGHRLDERWAGSRDQYTRLEPLAPVSSLVRWLPTLPFADRTEFKGGELLGHERHAPYLCHGRSA